MLRANAKWVDNYIIDVDNARGHFVKMDLPPSYKGDDTAATPLEYIVMSFAGCTVSTFKIFANKMRLNIDSIEISVEAKNPEDIQTVTEIKSILTVRTTEPESKIQKALERTRKMCPVGRIYEKAQIPAKIELVVTR